MESTEDDAGSANYTTRQTSARERDIGQMEDSNAITCVENQELQTPKIQDGPSTLNSFHRESNWDCSAAKDINPSTEAILDMIDQFVEDPANFDQNTSKQALSSADETQFETSSLGNVKPDIILDCESEAISLKTLSQNQSENTNLGVSKLLTGFEKEKALHPLIGNECKTSEIPVNCVTTQKQQLQVIENKIEKSELLASVPNTHSPLKRRLVRPARPEIPSASINKIKDSGSVVNTPQPDPLVSSLQINDSSKNKLIETSKSGPPQRKIKLIRNKINFPFLKLNESDKGERKDVLHNDSTSSPKAVNNQVQLTASIENESKVIVNCFDKIIDSPFKEAKAPSLHLPVSSKEPSIESVVKGPDDESSNSTNNSNSVSIISKPVGINVGESDLNLVTNVLTNLNATTETMVQLPNTEIIEKYSSDKTIESICSENKEILVKSFTESVIEKNITTIENIREPCVEINCKTSKCEISKSEKAEIIEPKNQNTICSSESNLKLTIKLRKNHTDNEIKLHSEKYIPLDSSKLQNYSKYEEKSLDHAPTNSIIKTDVNTLSPRLTIKSNKSDDHELSDDNNHHKPRKQLPGESPKENNQHLTIPKLTIKTITKNDEISRKVCMKLKNEDDEHLPVLTKLNIKPIPKPDEKKQECNEGILKVIPKINIKPIIRPQDEIGDTGNIDQIPKVTKLNIKPIKSPPEMKFQSKESSEWIDDNEKSIPFVTKINIKPIVRPLDETSFDSSENQSSETGNSSDENCDQIPVVTKLNIKPLPIPNNIESKTKHANSDDCTNIPVVTKINIKPILKPEEDKHSSKEAGNQSEIIPVVTKLNIKPLVAPPNSQQNDDELKNPPIVVKINMKSKLENSTCNVSGLSSNYDNDVLFDHLKDSEVTSGSNEIETVTSNESKEEFSSQSSEKSFDIDSTQETVSDCSSKNKDSTATDNTSLNIDILEQHSLPNMLDQNMVKDKYINRSDEDSSEISVYDDSASCELRMNKISENNVQENMELTDIVKSTDSSLGDDSQKISKPLEINTADKIASPGQNSPRIILKINKTDSGASAKIITDNFDIISQNHNSSDTIDSSDNKEIKSNKISEKQPTNPKTKALDTTGLSVKPRLRSATSTHETNIDTKKNSQKLNVSDTHEDKSDLLHQQLLSIQPIEPEKTTIISDESSESRHDDDVSNESDITPAINIHDNSDLTNDMEPENENANSFEIFSNYQKQNNKNDGICNTDGKGFSCSTTKKELCSIETNVINKPNDLDAQTVPSHNNDSIMELSKDPLELDITNVSDLSKTEIEIPKPQPKKRGRPRKNPLLDTPKPVVLPTPALEERPQRQSRLTREQQTPSASPARGRSTRRGRGFKRSMDTNIQQETEATPKTEKTAIKTCDIDLSSPCIKLPRMTEVLNKIPSSVTTPPRRRSSNASDSKPFTNVIDLKFVMDSIEDVSVTPRAGRGMRGRGAKRSPRYRGRGRGGGRGAVYMKETMGIYGRVCGPATTTPQLFEEETCMMDDNATPAKSIYDDDSPSTEINFTTEKAKKFQFSDIFDCKKATAAEVKEYTWPPFGSDSGESQVMMILEQVGMFLGVANFGRRYPDLKRRPVEGDEKDFIVSKGVVTESLCESGVTAVDASQILDILLSDFPHKYEEYRSHQREKERSETNSLSLPETDSTSERIDRIEMKLPSESKLVEMKPDTPKIDPEKLRQELLAAAIVSASEFNTRINAARSSSCADLQTMTIHRRLPQTQPVNPGYESKPDLYPLALLPGQYQHHYRVYTPEQLRYFPLNTALETPPAPASPIPSDTECDDGGSQSDSSDDSDQETGVPNKRPRLKARQPSQLGIKEESVDSSSREPTSCSASVEGVETCRACGLKESSRKYYHERFLVCANCQSKFHPSCMDLGADTIRKCRDYSWQCTDCKSCCGCSLPADEEKMIFCDLCDRGFHIYCVGLEKVPSGRWHCVECAICKSCGARDANGLSSAEGSSNAGEWHHQSKRGPGGHKMYSHSLCTPCARAYRIGRYCPLCDRSFIGPKGTLQLVICKLCDRQLHQDCVRQTVSNLNVLDYTCGECRRGGITSRSAAARLAPRTIATLFMAKRRFNKYAHRQYIESRRQAKGSPADLEAGMADESSDNCQLDPLDTSGDISQSVLLDEDTTRTLDGTPTPLAGDNNTDIEMDDDIMDE